MAEPLEPRAFGPYQVRGLLGRGGTGEVYLAPSNVLITPQGRPKLVDFGIATVVASAAAGDARTDSAALNLGSSRDRAVWLDGCRIGPESLIKGRSQPTAIAGAAAADVRTRPAPDGRRARQRI